MFFAWQCQAITWKSNVNFDDPHRQMLFLYYKSHNIIFKKKLRVDMWIWIDCLVINSFVIALHNTSNDCAIFSPQKSGYLKHVHFPGQALCMLTTSCCGTRPSATTMMTSSNRNIFRVIGHLCGEFTGHRWIPSTKARYEELWCFLWSAPE